MLSGTPTPESQEPEEKCELQTLIDSAGERGSVELEGRVYECPSSIIIRDKKRFTLKGKEGTVIVSMDADRSVIYATDTESLKLENLYLRHAEKPGGCGGGVLVVSDSKQVRVTNCILDGCGVVGISARDVKGLTVLDSIMRNNSQDGFRFTNTQDVSFENVAVHSNYEPFYGDMPKEFDCLGVSLEGRPYSFRGKETKEMIQFAQAATYDPLWAAVLAGDEDKVTTLLGTDAKGTVNEPRFGVPLLQIAIRERHGKVVSQLLQAGANPGLTDPIFDSTALDFALHSRQFSMVAELLAAGADPYRSNRRQFSAISAMEYDEDMREAFAAAGFEDESLLEDSNAAALFLALEIGDDTRALQLIESGVDLRVRIREDQALHAAAAQGHLSVIQALVEAGASVTRHSRYGQTPAGIAFSNGYDEAGMYLLGKMEDPGWRARGAGNLLMGASDIEHIKLLMERGVPMDVLCKGLFGLTLLHKVARHGDAAFVRTILDAGAPIDRSSTYGSALTQAAQFGKLQVLNLLIEAGADVEVTNWLSVSPLCLAAEGGHLECVKALMAAGADIQKPDDDGLRAVNLAAKNGHGEVATVLLEAGAEFFGKDGGNNSLLSAAAEGGLDDLIVRLLEFGCKVNGVDSRSMSALHAAAMRGQGSTVRLLVERGADLNALGGFGNRTPLETALSWSGNDESIRALLDLGATLDPNRRDEWNHTPLHLAAGFGYLRVMQDLINAGADVHARSLETFGDGTPHNSPLHMAAKHDRADAIRMLVLAGASVDALNANNESPLLLTGGWVDGSAAQMLIAARANANLSGLEVMPPLHEATRWGKVKKLHILLAAGADVNRVHAGETALHIAAESQDWEMAAWLLDAGADPNLTNAEGQTPAQLALKKGKELCAYVLTPKPKEALIKALDAIDLDGIRKALLEGANPTQVLEDGATPLHQLARHPATGLDAAKILLAYGADPNALGRDNNPPLYLLVQRETGEEFVRALLAAGADPKFGREAPLQLAQKQGNPKMLQWLSGTVGIPKVPVIARGGYPHPAQQASRTCQALVVKGEHQEALKQIDLALRLKPRDGQFRFFRAKLRAFLDDSEGADKDFKIVLEDLPNWLDFRFEYGKFLLEKGEHAEALVNFNFVSNRYFGEPYVQLLFARGRAHLSLSHNDEALADFQTCNQAVPNNKDILLRLGSAQHALGNDEEACQSWKAAAAAGDETATSLVEKHCSS